MDVHQLRCFVAVAHEGNFGRAAKALHLTTSPVSRAVRDLERDLGGALFIRGHHHIELTPAGRHLLDRVEPLLAALDRVHDDVRRVAQNSARALRVGGTHMAPQEKVDRVVEVAEELYPSRQIELTLASSAELLPAVKAGEIDLAIVHLPVEDQDLECLPLASYRMCVVLREDDPLASRSGLRIADLCEHTFITMADSVQPAAMGRLRDALTAHGVRRFEVVAAADVLMVAAKVRRRSRAALIPCEGEAARMFEHSQLRVVRIDDAVTMELGVVWRGGLRQMDAAVPTIVEQLRSELTAR